MKQYMTRITNLKKLYIEANSIILKDKTITIGGVPSDDWIDASRKATVDKIEDCEIWKS